MIPEFDQFPIFYFTNHHSIRGEGRVVCMPDHFEKLDFELECAILICKHGRNIRAEDADQYIGGLMVMNDFSARRLQMEEMLLNLGPAKGKDFVTTIGPCLVTLDELEPFEIAPKENHVGKNWNLRMQCFVNGQQVSDGNLGDMDWTFAEIIERASYGVDLFPGDIIGSGTVGTGCFLELNGTGKLNDSNYQEQWLQEGDVVELEIEQLGKLSNTIVRDEDEFSILKRKKKRFDRLKRSDLYKNFPMLLDLKNLSISEKQNYLQHAIAPRPICFASTVDESGRINLSPFSFFNIFSINPPIVIFSPSRRGRDKTTKHTYENVLQVPEVVINIVDYEMVQQTSLTSCEFPKEVNEFHKAGFTEEAATVVRPPMVKESKVKLECKVLEVKSLGDLGGSGNLVICEVILMHIDENILNEKGMIDQTKLHHVARLGGDWYCRVDESNLFQVEKPNIKLGIGFDALPASVRASKILSGNDLGLLANVHETPEIDAAFEDDHLKQIIQYYSVSPEEMEKEIHQYAKKLLGQGKVREAWQVLLST